MRVSEIRSLKLREMDLEDHLHANDEDNVLYANFAALLDDHSDDEQNDWTMHNLYVAWSYGVCIHATKLHHDTGREMRSYRPSSVK